MASDVEQALWAFEEAVDGLLSFVKASSYGVRLATRRVTESAGAVPRRGSAASGPSEMEALIESLEHADDRLSDVFFLALGDYLRAFLARALQLPALPNLPGSPSGVEDLAGTPGALSKAPPWVGLLLQLYRVTLKGGALDREALQVLGKTELELPFPGGKVKLFRAGDRITLTEHQMEEAGRALAEAARAVYLRLVTA
ncbi:MAG: hypothetical protein HY900_19710 [Deltaproteobacteria bacterium]|nr:hypothetical protein [Deltaproteobacteria bacterium]